MRWRGLTGAGMRVPCSAAWLKRLRCAGAALAVALLPAVLTPDATSVRHFGRSVGGLAQLHAASGVLLVPPRALSLGFHVPAFVACHLPATPLLAASSRSMSSYAFDMHPPCRAMRCRALSCCWHARHCRFMQSRALLCCLMPRHASPCVAHTPGTPSHALLLPAAGSSGGDGQQRGA